MHKYRTSWCWYSKLQGFQSHYWGDLCTASSAASFEKSTSMNVVVMVSFVPSCLKESLWITVNLQLQRKGVCECVCALCERWHRDRGSVTDPVKALLTFRQGERKGQRRERKTLSVWSYVRLLLNFILWNIPHFVTVAIVTHLFNWRKYLNWLLSQWTID